MSENQVIIFDTTLRDGFWIGFGFGMGIHAVDGLPYSFKIG